MYLGRNPIALVRSISTTNTNSLQCRMENPVSQSHRFSEVYFHEEILKSFHQHLLMNEGRNPIALVRSISTETNLDEHLTAGAEVFVAIPSL